MKNFIQPGKVLTAVAPAGGVTSGGFYVFGALFGVASTSADEGAEFELALGGVYEVGKVAAQAWSFGEAIYYDSGADLMTTVPTGNTKVGVAAADAANPSGLSKVRLNEAF